MMWLAGLLFGYTYMHKSTYKVKEMQLTKLGTRMQLINEAKAFIKNIVYWQGLLGWRVGFT